MGSEMSLYFFRISHGRYSGASDQPYRIRKPRGRLDRDDHGLRQPSRRHFAQPEAKRRMADGAPGRGQEAGVSESAWSRKRWARLRRAHATAAPVDVGTWRKAYNRKLFSARIPAFLRELILTLNCDRAQKIQLTTETRAPFFERQRERLLRSSPAMVRFLSAGLSRFLLSDFVERFECPFLPASVSSPRSSPSSW